MAKRSSKRAPKGESKRRVGLGFASERTVLELKVTGTHAKGRGGQANLGSPRLPVWRAEKAKSCYASGLAVFKDENRKKLTHRKTGSRQNHGTETHAEDARRIRADHYECDACSKALTI